MLHLVDGTITTIGNGFTDSASGARETGTAETGSITVVGWYALTMATAGWPGIQGDADLSPVSRVP